MSATDPPARAKCARCVAGLCGHERCRPGGRYEIAVTAVAGTPCCGECAGPLLEMVLHPLRVPVVIHEPTLRMEPSK